MSIEICSKIGNKTKSKTTPPHTLETVGPFTIDREGEKVQEIKKKRGGNKEKEGEGEEGR